MDMSSFKKSPIYRFVNKNIIGIVFALLVLLFIFIVASLFITYPVFIKNILSLFIEIFVIIYFLLGVVLIFLTYKKKIKGKQKKLLFLTGASASGIFLSSLLHNFLFALSVLAFDIKHMYYFLVFLHMTFFFVAVFICPLGFIIGVIGTIFMYF